MYHQFNNWRTSTLRRNRWRSAPQRITSWAAYKWIQIRKCPKCPACSPQANVPPESTAPTAWAAIRSPIFWFSGNAPANSLQSSQKRIRQAKSICVKSKTSRVKRWLHSTESSGESPYQMQKDLQETMQDSGRDRTYEGEMRRGPGKSMVSKSARKRRQSAVIVNTIRAGTLRLI